MEDVQSFAQNIVDTVREPLLILDANLCIRSANRAFYQTFQVCAGETENGFIYEIGNGQWDIPALRTLREDIIPQQSIFSSYELSHDFPTIGPKVMLLNTRQLRAGNHPKMLVLAMEDITKQRRIHDLELRFTEGLQQSYKRLQEHADFGTYRRPGQRPAGNGFHCEMVSIAISGGELLLGMINDLLEVEKLESGTMLLDITLRHAAALVDSAVRQVASLAGSEGLILSRQVESGLPALWGGMKQSGGAARCKR